MAAGLGFKTFNTGDVLSAGDTNGYLMQGVLVFADAAARTAAITSPQEGQVSYLKDTDVVQTYSGSAWVTVGGASGGMTSIASGSLSGANVNLTSISQSYKDLKLVIRGPQQSSDEDFYIRPNNDATGPYAVIGGTSLSATMVVSTNRSNVSATDVLGNSLMESSVTDNFVMFDFPDYTAIDNHIIQMHNAYTNDSAVNVAGFSVTNYCPATPVAITSINIISDAGSWTGGTYILYGVS